MKPTLWPAPAKLNLFLHVTGRRADGYHNLQTVFQFLDYGDTLEFEVTESAVITRAQPLAQVPSEADLCVRAARLLQETAGVTQGVSITLHKRLPLGGGLGGGSSDAATTLLVLNQLWKLALPLDQLADLGLKLGADVPVFVRGRAAWAEGIGEQLSPVELPEPWYVVLIPPVQVSTAEVFQALQLTAYSPAITIRGFHAGQGRNDLEPVVCRLYPEVDKALTWLKNFGDARMTGSGACVYLPVTEAARAQEILAMCPKECAQGFVARGINRHPLHDR